MTYYELLHQVKFDDLIPYIERYHGSNSCMALYKIHYDYLCHLTPRQEEDDNKIATISNAELDYSWEEPHLDAHPMEGDYWEVSLAKELVIESDVNATLEEIAACCLWHTSFYGFTKKQREESFEKLDYYSRNLLDRDITRIKMKIVTEKIKEWGGQILSIKEMLCIPSFRSCVRKPISIFRKRQRLHIQQFGNKYTWRRYARRAIQRKYNERVLFIGNWIESAFSPDNVDGTSIADLCKLYWSNHMKPYTYRSYAYDEAKRMEWMMDLIDKYNAFNHGTLSNCIVSISTSSEHPLKIEEMALIQHILKDCKGKNSFIVKVDDTLNEEMGLSVAFYE